ncbi:MAG TPA: hypothetical protein VH682_00960 [Gemmataceae bacterium]|jgi:hypothetical protein
MAYVEATGAIFQEKKFSERCWTHDLEELLKLANLGPTLVADIAADPSLGINWGVAKSWKETSRYEQRTQAEAQSMYDAITNDPHGVLAWIRIRW